MEPTCRISRIVVCHFLFLILEALAEFGLAFAPMIPNFFCYFLTSWIRVREEGLKFGLTELKQLFPHVLSPRSLVVSPIEMSDGERNSSFLRPTQLRSVILTSIEFLGSGPMKSVKILYD